MPDLALDPLLEPDPGEGGHTLEDLLNGFSPDEDAPPAPSGDATAPDQAEDPMKQLANLIAGVVDDRLTARGVGVPAKTTAPEPGQPITAGFTPESIVQASVKAARALRTMERQVREQYAQWLTEDDVEVIMDSLGQQPYEQLVNSLQSGAHIAAANVVVGSKVATGALKPPQNGVQRVAGGNKSKPLPPGGAPPRTAEPSPMKKYKELYGKPRTAGSAQRLLDGGL
jgi:hypothetical protein